MLNRFLKSRSAFYRSASAFAASNKPYFLSKNRFTSHHGEKAKFWKRTTPVMLTTFAGMCYVNSLTTDEEFKSKISPLKLVNETTAAECASASEACKRDLLKSRVNIIQYPANFPCEDRFDAVQFNKSNGYYTAVFDGHGGWQVSEYAMKYYKIRIENKVGIKLPLLRTGCVTGYLPVYLNEYLKDSKTSEDVHNAIYKAFDQVEAECYQKLKAAFEIGFGKSSTVGSCALITVVKGNKLYVANAGDCEAVLLRREDDGSLTPVRICRPFTCNDPEEQNRLKAEFPKESDIVMCRGQDACYVKGCLMPTRSFGDFRLKYSEMNFHNQDPINGFRPPIQNYNGPYITHKPEIREFDLTSKDVFVVLASDGLWDEIKFDEVGKLLKEKSSNGVEISQTLLNTVLNRSAERHGKSRDFISQLPPGDLKRSIVDDVTIVVVNLANQFE